MAPTCCVLHSICEEHGNSFTEEHPDRHVNIQPPVQALPERGNPEGTDIRAALMEYFKRGNEWSFFFLQHHCQFCNPTYSAYLFENIRTVRTCIICFSTDILMQTCLFRKLVYFEKQIKYNEIQKFLKNVKVCNVCNLHYLIISDIRLVFAVYTAYFIECYLSKQFALMWIKALFCITHFYYQVCLAFFIS